MGLVDDFAKVFDNHMYDVVIKPRVTLANSKPGAPIGQSGTLDDNTYVFLSDESTPDEAVVVVVSDPPQTAPYNKYEKDFGSVDYANFTNARGSTKGWFDRYVRAVARCFSS